MESILKSLTEDNYYPPSPYEAKPEKSLFNFNVWKKVFFIVIFFLVTPIALGTSIFSLATLESAKGERASHVVISSVKSQPRVYATGPTNLPSVSGEIISDDARTEIIRQYLDRYESPLISYAPYLIEISDKYDIDFKLLTAIAQQESNLCKRIPEGTHNCWGWGIHSKGTLGFESYEESINAVAYGLRNNYHDIGLYTPEEIMSKWVPHSPQGAWAKGVTQFMAEME